MKIQSGHKYLDDVKQIKGNSVSFCTDDGRVMFEVSICDDGKSINVRGVEMTKHDGVIHSELLSVMPRSANSVNVGTQVYDKK